MQLKKLMATTALTLFALGTLAGCGGQAQQKKAEPEAHNKLKVVATIFPDYDMAREVAGDKAEVSLLLPPGADAHTYEFKPEDMAKIKDADVLFYTDKEMEPWIEKVQEQIGDAKKPVLVALSDGIDRNLPKDLNVMAENDGDAHEDEGDTHEHEGEAHEHEGEAHEHEEAEGHHHHHHGADPHIWTSLKNAQIMTDTIAKTLAAQDKTNASIYEANAKSYKEKLQTLDEKYRKMIDGAKRKTIVVADEFPFAYFARDYGLRYASIYDSYEEHAEGSARRMAQLVDYMKANHIPVVYYTEISEPKLATKLAESAGAETMMLDAVHTMTQEDMKNHKTYLAVMEDNIKALEKGLN